jgi:hypothetical protein
MLLMCYYGGNIVLGASSHGATEFGTARPYLSGVPIAGDMLGSKG